MHTHVSVYVFEYSWKNVWKEFKQPSLHLGMCLREIRGGYSLFNQNISVLQKYYNKHTHIPLKEE